MSMYGSQKGLYMSRTAGSKGDMNREGTNHYARSEVMHGGGNGYDPYFDGNNTYSFSKSSGGGMAGGMLGGMSSGMMSGMGGGMSSGMMSGMGGGMSSGMMSGMGERMSGSMAGGLSGGMSGGLRYDFIFYEGP